MKFRLNSSRVHIQRTRSTFSLIDTSPSAARSPARLPASASATGTTMAPPRSHAKRGARPRPRPRAPPNPSTAPPAAPAADPSNPRHQLLRAAHDGDLRLLKRLVGELDKGRGRPREVVEAAEKEAGFGALFFAAGYGGLPVCRYLVEELGVDVDAAHHHEDTTPLACAILGGNSDTVRYLLDHGADPARADNTGFAPLHHAAGRV